MLARDVARDTCDQVGHVGVVATFWCCVVTTVAGVGEALIPLPVSLSGPCQVNLLRVVQAVILAEGVARVLRVRVASEVWRR
jgi:hypothetical protein